MVRRTTWGLGVLLAHAVLVLALMTGASSAWAAARNVVLIIGDDHGMQVGCYGDKVIKSPAMDRLAERGTRFANAFATVSSCSPSRSTILTGQFVHTNGQYGLAHATHNFHSFESVKSLPNLLSKAGYRTAIVGKHHNKPESVYAFDEKLPCPGGARNVRQMADAAGKFMAGGSDKPFFLVVGFVDPHRAVRGFANEQKYPGIERITYDPAKIVVPPWLPDNAEVRADLAEYYESISRLDQGVGLVVEAIKASGHEDDTLVIYVSDNGPPFPGGKTTLYDPGIHLPLIIRSPAQKQSGVVNQAMVSFADIAPTILDWAGVAVPEAMAGRSMLPILDQKDPQGWDTVYGSHIFHEVTMYYPTRMIRTRQYKYLLNLASPLERPLASDLWRSDTWQGVLRRGDERYGQRTVQALLHCPKEELYDLSKDPGETVNLADDPAHAELIAKFRGQMREWQKQTNDPWAIKYEHE